MNAFEVIEWLETELSAARQADMEAVARGVEMPEYQRLVGGIAFAGRTLRALTNLKRALQGEDSNG
jgi:hypothetical protein